MEGAFVCRNKNAPTRDENGGMDGEALESIFMIVSFCSARYICSIWVIGHFLRKHFWAEITILSRQSNTTNELELKKQQRDQSETFTRRRKLPTHITKWLKEPKWLPTWKLVVNLRSTTVVDDVDSSNNYNASCEWSNSIKQSEQYFKVGFISEKNPMIHRRWKSVRRNHSISLKPLSSLYNATSYATSAYAQRYAQLGKSNIIIWPTENMVSIIFF